MTDAQRRMAEGVRGYSESIRSENPGFRQQVLQAVRSKVARVKEKHKGLDDLAAAVGIRLTEKADPATVIPIAPKVRSTIASTLREVVGHLRRRLTWQDGYGVAIVLSQNAGFSDVLASVAETLPKVEGFVLGSLQTKAANHFVARFTIPSDDARQASIHVLVYNLYVSEPGKRTGPRHDDRLLNADVAARDVKDQRIIECEDCTRKPRGDRSSLHTWVAVSHGSRGNQVPVASAELRQDGGETM